MIMGENMQVIHSGKYLDTVIVSEERNGVPKDWEGVFRKGKGEVVGVFLENIERESFVFVEQYRPLVQSKVLELVAGLVDEGFTSEQAAIQEVEEETGYKTQSLDFLLKGPKSPGMTNEFSYDFYAQTTGNPGEQQLEESEFGLITHETHNTVADVLKFTNSKEKEGIMVSPGIWAAVGKALAMGKISI